jgi:sporulation protein YlmC with PRC-barrel domain
MDGKQVQDSSQEQSRPVQSGGSPQPSEHRPQRFDRSLRGRKVISADGQAVGEITDLVVNSDLWQVESVQLKLNNAVADRLGIRRGKFHAGTIDIPVRMIQSVGDAVVLAVPASALRPSLTSSHDAAA